MSLEVVKKLRDSTLAGFADCKRAVEEANGDYDLALKHLRERGVVKAAGKLDRDANEGYVGYFYNETVSILKVNCETDFASRGERFAEFLNALLQKFSASKTTDANAFSQETDVFVKENIAIIGENLKISGAVKETLASDEAASFYVHFKSPAAINLGRIVVCVIHKYKNKELCDDFAKKIAMHIAASSVVGLSEKDIPSSVLESEREIYSNQIKEEAKTSNSQPKPDAVIQKIVDGKIRKFIEDSVLLEQKFVMDTKLKIKDVIADFNKTNGESFEITKFFKVSI